MASREEPVPSASALTTPRLSMISKQSSQCESVSAAEASDLFSAQGSLFAPPSLQATFSSSAELSSAAGSFSFDETLPQPRNEDGHIRHPDMRQAVLYQLKREADALRHERDQLARMQELRESPRMSTEYYSDTVEEQLNAQDEFFLSKSTPWKETESLRAAVRHAEETISSVVKFLGLDDEDKDDFELTKSKSPCPLDGHATVCAPSLKKTLRAESAMSPAISDVWPFAVMQVESVFPTF